MRSPSCNVVPGQLGWNGSDDFYEDDSLLDNDHWELQQMGKEDEVGFWMLDAGRMLLIAISFLGRLIDVIEVKKVLKGPKGRHCLGFMARCLSLNVPLLPNDRNQFFKEKKETMSSVRMAFRLPTSDFQEWPLPASKLTSC
ncbi:hypothetical protein B9Z55_009491 [Caenorhabditis nigoni]|uniref:Uncharacterized protein n=1 Tax=Caenorhabditis nigoni TaxID=1611254 RepID=A0A2G5US77_9PELO|nr:hypothetical protein B9Z55_009491 [Caenorhabditis nigoni]